MYTAIAAMDKNRVIGNSHNDKIPRSFSEDFQWFKEKTVGSPIIMGATTFKSLKYKPLDGRINIVLSTTLKQEDHKGVLIYKSLAEILNNHPEGYVIGGAQIYNLFAEQDLLDEVIITHIDGEFEGDVKLPEIEKDMIATPVKKIKAVNRKEKDGKEYDLEFVNYKR